MNGLYEIKDTFAHLIQVTELRPVRGDDVPMSPMNGRDSVGIHFTWVHKLAETKVALASMEKVLSKYNAKPHFGKVFAMNGQRFEELFGAGLFELRKLL